MNKEEKNQKITISPSQAILLYISNLRVTEDTTAAEKLYLTGVNSENDRKLFQQICRNPTLKKYCVSTDFKIINEDRTRRYFETQLAYHTVLDYVTSIDLSKLKQFLAELESIVQEEDELIVGRVLQGKHDDEDTLLVKEYIDHLERIKNKTLYPDLDNETARTTIEYIIKCTFVSVYVANNDKLPINIYGKGIYNSLERGKSSLPQQTQVRTRSYGLLKSYMPVPEDDVARLAEEHNYIKSADQASYTPNAYWIQHNAKKLMHPFSNSISGTVLCQLRANLELDKNKKGLLDSFDDFIKYIRLAISSLLFHSGGHSLYEFCAVFSVEIIKKMLGKLDGYQHITIESLFYHNNANAFQTALMKTIEFNHRVLVRQSVHAELINLSVFNDKKPVLKKVIRTGILHQFEQQIDKYVEQYDDFIKQQRFGRARLGQQKLKFLKKYSRLIEQEINNEDVEQIKLDINNMQEKYIMCFGENKSSKSLAIVKNIVKEFDRIYQHLQEQSISGRDHAQT